MSVVDNPLFQAVGEHLGLGSIFQQAQGATQMAAAPPAPGKSAPNVPEYRSRPYIPRNEMTVPGQQTVRGVQPGPQITPGVMDPATLQSPNVKQLLGMYGVTPPDGPPDPNLFIHNPAAFNKHPIIAGMLERGLEGVANQHLGNNFMDTFINGIQGIQNANAQRAAQANAQVMAPLQQAQMIQQLVGAANKQNDEHQVASATIARDQAMGDYYKSTAQSRAERLLLMGRPETSGPYKGRMWYPQDDGQGGYKWAPDPNFVQDPEEVLRSKLSQGIMADLQKKYPDGNIPPEEAQKALLGLMSGESVAKEAGKNLGRKITGQYQLQWHKFVSRFGSGGAPKMDPHARLAWQDYKDQGDKLVGLINKNMNSNEVFTDEDGKVIASPSSKQAWLGKQQAKLAQIQNAMQTIENEGGAMNNIYRLMGSDAPVLPNRPAAAPSYSANNPFAKKK